MIGLPTEREVYNFEGKLIPSIPFAIVTSSASQEFNESLNEGNKENINKQVDYNNYNELNDLLNSELENWEKNQNEINEIND